MSIMALFSGKKPNRQGASRYETQLGQQATGLHAAAAKYGEGVDAMNRDLALGRTAERSVALGADVADTAQTFAAQGPATSTGGALERALTRGRGLSRLLGARSNEVDTQLLRDRVASVGQARQRQGLGLSMLAQSAGLDRRLTDATRQGKMVADDAKSNMMGSVAGIGLGVLANRGTLFPNLGKPKGIGGVGAGGSPNGSTAAYA